MTIEDIDLVELNEAFAAQNLHYVDKMDIPDEKINVNGGEIALGHLLGCSGARISTILLHEMEKQNADHGLATMCVGFGQSMATIFERI